MIHEEFDHTSLLRYLSDKWSLGPLTERVARAKNIAPFIRTDGQPRSDTPESLAVPTELAAVATEKMVAAESEPLNCAATVWRSSANTLRTKSWSPPENRCVARR